MYGVYCCSLKLANTKIELLNRLRIKMQQGAMSAFKIEALCGVDGASCMCVEWGGRGRGRGGRGGGSGWSELKNYRDLLKRL
jgi:hypothetical protein